LIQAEHSWVQAVCFSASQGLNTPGQKHLRPPGASPHGLCCYSLPTSLSQAKERKNQANNDN
jgi:hypothetical protein